MGTTDASENKGCLGAVLRALFSGSTKSSCAYRLRDDFLSAAETSFFHVLRSIVGDRAVICPKVRLSDIFFVPQGKGQQSAQNRINSRHVDFVLCDTKSLRPKLAVELDDSSHGRADRHARDDFVDDLFKSTALPLVRIPAQRQYRPDDVASRIAPLLEGGVVNAATPAQLSSPQLTIPLCPKCGTPMVLRTGTRGSYRNKQFYGCPNYPQCQQIAPLP